MRFYDVTSWSYVNLDDPMRECGVVYGDRISQPMTAVARSVMIYQVLRRSYFPPLVIEGWGYELASLVVPSPSLSLNFRAKYKRRNAAKF